MDRVRPFHPGAETGFFGRRSDGSTGKGGTENMPRHGALIQCGVLLSALLLAGCCDCTFDRAFAKAAPFNDTPGNPAAGTWTGTWKVTGPWYVGEPRVQPVRAAVLIDQDKRWKINLLLRTPEKHLLLIFGTYTDYPYNWLVLPVDIRPMPDGSDAFAGHGIDYNDPIADTTGDYVDFHSIAELFGTAKGDMMHISISFYANAWYIGPRTPVYRGEIDLHREKLPPTTQAGPAAHPAASAPKMATLATQQSGPAINRAASTAPGRSTAAGG
jgi:hypothetical protein